MIPPEQMAFKGRTTTDALLYVETIIRAAWANGRVVTLLSLDMTKAFDRVKRARLLEILHQRGVPASLIVLIRSFLSDRTTTIRMPGQSSSRSYSVNIGIPQGSPLSPILFLFYTAPLLEALAKPIGGPCSRHQVAFSDDIAIMRASESLYETSQSLSEDFQICAAWAKEHNMEFNPKKFDCMHFSRLKEDHKSPRWNFFPRIPGFEVGEHFGEQLKLLGVMLDPELNWGPHMAYVRMRAFHGRNLTLNDHSSKRPRSHLLGEPSSGFLRLSLGHQWKSAYNCTKALPSLRWHTQTPSGFTRVYSSRSITSTYEQQRTAFCASYPEPLMVPMSPLCIRSYVQEISSWSLGGCGIRPSPRLQGSKYGALSVMLIARSTRRRESTTIFSV
jgi:hypothetical protein